MKYFYDNNQTECNRYKNRTQLEFTLTYRQSGVWNINFPHDNDSSVCKWRCVVNFFVFTNHAMSEERKKDHFLTKFHSGVDFEHFKGNDSTFRENHYQSFDCDSYFSESPHVLRFAYHSRFKSKMKQKLYQFGWPRAWLSKIKSTWRVSVLH